MIILSRAIHAQLGDRAMSDDVAAVIFGEASLTTDQLTNVLRAAFIAEGNGDFQFDADLVDRLNEIRAIVSERIGI
jgi:hypothetical protein